MKWIRGGYKALAAFTASALILAQMGGCAGQGQTDLSVTAQESTTDAGEAKPADSQPSLVQAIYDAVDLEDSWQEEGCTRITAVDTDVEIDGEGAVAEGAIVTISQPGIYVLSGTLTEGQVRVDAGKEDVVRLVLDGISITNSRTAPIYGIQCRKLVVTLAEGAENRVEDGQDYQFEESGQDEPDSPIFCEDDLTLNGMGSLAVVGNFDHGIHSKDNLKIVSGTITVTSAGDGLKGKDSVAVKDGVIAITAGGDGIQSNHDADSQKGYVVLEGGDYQIQAGNDGIQAETVLEILGGDYGIVTGEGSSQAGEDDGESRKGLKAGTALRIAGGAFTIDSQDDSIHSNGDVQIAGGVMELASGDDGIHADSNVTVDDGQITVIRSYEGIEGTSIDILGGTIDLKSSDDGVNAAGGRDGSGANRGRDQFAVEEDAYIRIRGGSLKVDAEGDGIDSNGHLSMEGGEVYVSGPEDAGNGILDFNGDGLISGGTFLGTGSSGMFQTFSGDSSQHTLVVFYPMKQGAGTAVQVLDASGGELASVTAPKEFDALMVSTPDLATGDTVKVKAGEEEQDVTLDGVVTRSGEQAQRGFGGRGHTPPSDGTGQFPPDGAMSGNGIPEGGPSAQPGRGGRPEGGQGQDRPMPPEGQGRRDQDISETAEAAP